MQDIVAIQQIEREYYEGFSCPQDILKFWIASLSDNFLVAEEKNCVIAFLFFEYLNKVKAIPFVHKLEHRSNGKYVYVSEVGVSDEYLETSALQTLFDNMKRKATSDNCKGIVWLTGSKSKHDKIEKGILADNLFKKQKRVEDWEAYPGYCVSDHFIWYKDIRG